MTQAFENRTDSGDDKPILDAGACRLDERLLNAPLSARGIIARRTSYSLVHEILT